MTIDQGFADAIGAANPIVLLPHIGYEPEWIIDKRKHEVMIPAAVKANKRMASLFANNVYCRKLGYRQEAAECLYYMSGTLIGFLLCDRLLRLNALFRSGNGSAIAVPEVRYKFDTSMSTSNFLGKAIEADPVFNQWILNTLLPEAPRVEVQGCSTHAAEGGPDPHSVAPLWRKLVSILEKEGPRGVVLRLWSRVDAVLDPILRTLRRPFALRAVPHYLTHCSEVFAERGFYWPNGPLDNLPSLLIHPRGNTRTGPTIRREDFLELSEAIQDIFRQFLLECGESTWVPRRTFEALGTLAVELQSEFAVEHAPEACEWAIRQMAPYRSKGYFTGWPAAGILPSLYTFAAKQLGRTVIGMQHSAWGGYLAYGALVTEWIILGSDDYVTFGWEKPEDGLSAWTRRAIPLPGPFLSHYGLAAKAKRSSVNDVKRRVLLATGFLYRFPSIPNSSLKLDTVNLWADELHKIVKGITELGIEVTIIMYNEIVASLHRPIMDMMLRAGGGLAVEHSDHNFRVRELIFSGKFDEHYDAVVWDLPAGGFSEALTAGICTFALCDEKLISILPEGESIIRNLVENGILFESVEQLKSSLGKMYADQSWYRSNGVQGALERFQNKFCRVSAQWEKDWRNFLASYQ